VHGNDWLCYRGLTAYSTTSPPVVTTATATTRLKRQAEPTRALHRQPPTSQEGNLVVNTGDSPATTATVLLPQDSTAVADLHSMAATAKTNTAVRINSTRATARRLALADKGKDQTMAVRLLEATDSKLDTVARRKATMVGRRTTIITSTTRYVGWRCNSTKPCDS
jgi:hypothetical protein